MAVHLRLQRHGSKHRPFYHVVATDHRSSRDGRFIEKLGYYDPAHEPSTIELDADRVQFWYSKGAQLSNTVEKFAKLKKIELKRHGQKA